MASRTIGRLGALLLTLVVVTGGCELSVAPTPPGSSASTTATPSLPAGPSTPGATPSTSASPAASPALPTAKQLIGQRLVVAMNDATPSAALLNRISLGEVGGVILFGKQTSDPVTLATTTAMLQDAAASGGQPTLLVMTDQEGGDIRRLAWAPPELSAHDMGAKLSAAAIREQGRLTGAALAEVGINVDLAPVADVPASTSVFMYLQQRVFSMHAAVTSDLAGAFAAGLLDGGVLSTMKHFPGIGRAVRNTDNYVVTISATKAQLATDLTPYTAAIKAKVPLIMLSNAVYPALDANNGAGWSPAIAETLLRQDMHFAGVTITDALDGAAHSRNVSEGSLALRAAEAGTDLLLLVGSEEVTNAVFNLLVSAAGDGRLSMDSLLASNTRILALKATLAP